MLVNPRLIEVEGEILSKEGCLSCPEIEVEAPRAERVKVVARDLAGRSIELAADGSLAIALQHEIDHLEGRLIVDKLSSLKKKLYRDKLKKAALREE